MKIKLRAELKATEIEAQVNEEYEADAESEDKASVADSEGEFGSDDLNSEVDFDMNGSRPKNKSVGRANWIRAASALVQLCMSHGYKIEARAAAEES